MQPSLLGWSNLLADYGGFWVDRHSERFAMGLKTEHRSGIRHSGAQGTRERNRRRSRFRSLFFKIRKRPDP